MGGIKNREEKKKLNHVVSSGGGGGMKGPATVDKRLGAEMPCPYCDRVFKQVHHISLTPACTLDIGRDPKPPCFCVGDVLTEQTRIERLPVGLLEALCMWQSSSEATSINRPFWRHMVPSDQVCYSQTSYTVGMHAAQSIQGAYRKEARRGRGCR